jgi:hypothetical protein
MRGPAVPREFDGKETAAQAWERIGNIRAEISQTPSPAGEKRESDEGV